jgi:Secretion system C-terminal sorting domain
MIQKTLQANQSLKLTEPAVSFSPQLSSGPLGSTNMEDIMKRSAELMKTVLSISLAACSLAVCQSIPVKSLQQGNAFLYEINGTEMGGIFFDYYETDIVRGDTVINGMTFHSVNVVGGGGQLEYSDSNQWSELYGTVVDSLCDFRWPLGKNVPGGGAAPWVVNDTGTAIIFSDTLPYMSMSISGLSGAGNSGTRIIVKKYGLAYEHVVQYAYYSYINLRGAKINGVVYGSTPTSVTQQRESSSSEASVGVYPNPTSGLLKVQITNQTPSELKIDIFNIRGQRVGSLYNGIVARGERVFNWKNIGVNGHELPSGVYFIQVQIGSRTTIRRILLLH